MDLDRFKPYEGETLKPIAYCTYCQEPITADQAYVRDSDHDPYCDKDCFCDHMGVRRVNTW